MLSSEPAARVRPCAVLGRSCGFVASKAMPRSEILLHELASDDPVRLADEGSVVVSSAGAGWSGVGAELQHLPAADPPEGYMPWHLLSVQLSPPPLYEQRRGGRVTARRRLAPGDVIFHPAGVPTHASWTGRAR
jgi:hypothetical protein